MMLFSATIGQKLKELARINLKQKYEYICIHDFDSIESRANDYSVGGKVSAEDQALTEQLKSVTPVKLLHYYMQVNIDEKLDTLFSFLKSHQSSKVIVFFSACKQVRFAYEAFKRLKAGNQILELHGRQKQTKRTAVYFEFVERKNSTLFCTDIASRGIDFPAVDWVVQYDCPEDVYTYIHRVGRTARYKSKGNSLLLLTPAELKFVDRIDKRGIQLKKLNANANKSLTIQPTLQKLNAENRDVKHLAEKACISYIKSIYLMKDKEVFQFDKLDCEKLALSLGLASAPQIGFVQKTTGDHNAKNAQRTNEDEPKKEEVKKVSRLQRLKEMIKEKKEQKKQEALAPKVVPEKVVKDSEDSEGSDEDSYADSYFSEGEPDFSDNSEAEEVDEDFFTSKKNQRQIESDGENEEGVEELKVSKKKLSKITKDGPFSGKNKIFFNAQGVPISSLEYHLKQDSFDLKKSQLAA